MDTVMDLFDVPSVSIRASIFLLVSSKDDLLFSISIIFSNLWLLALYYF